MRAAQLEEAWSRLLAFREHLPEHYEIHERLVREYHLLIDILQGETGNDLSNFRISAEDVRPRVVSATYATRRRPGRVKYSNDKYCLRTTLLMKLDALIRFIELRASRPNSEINGVALIPSERVALAIYRYVESVGAGRWQAMSMGQLGTVTSRHGALLVDRLKDLSQRRIIGLRKWYQDLQRFVHYPGAGRSDEEFFYHGSFEVMIEPGGRPWFERLERKEEAEAETAALNRPEPEVTDSQISQSSPSNRPAFGTTSEAQSSAKLGENPKVFLSYSWDGEQHKAWVRELATRLREHGLETVLDQWYVRLGDRLPEFMERAVHDSDYVLVICTEKYKARFDERQGGVGYEGHIISGELINSVGQNRFIPVLRSGDWDNAVPSALMGVKGVDLRGDPYSSAQYQELVRELHGVQDPVPAIGKPPPWLGETLQPTSVPPSTRVPAETVPSADAPYPLHSISDGERCPGCKSGHLHWLRWGPGPAGSFSAWFQCDECAREFPSLEVFEGGPG